MLRRTLLTAVFAALLLGLGVTGGAPAQATPASDLPTNTVSVIAAEPGPCPYSGTHPTIRRGSTGSVVVHLQCLLRHVWGYNIAIDGIFGPATERAVLSRQSICGIAKDGIVGPNTWNCVHP